MAHAVFENKELNLHDLMKVRHASSLRVDWDYIDFVGKQRGWIKGLDVGLATIARLEGQLLDKPSVPFEHQRRVLQRIDGSTDASPVLAQSRGEACSTPI